MKRLILILLMLIPMFAMSKIATDIFTIDSNGQIITKSQFVDLPYDRRINSRKFSLSNDTVQVQVGTVAYTVKIGRFNGWDNEPGDYDVIEISKDGNQVCLHREGDAILKLKEGSSHQAPESVMANNLFGKYANNNYYIEVPLSSSSKALLFFCPSYTRVGKTLIFVLTESDVKLVLNKNLEPKEMKGITSDFEMQLIADVPGYNLKGDQISVPTYTIWKKGGVFKYKNNYATCSIGNYTNVCHLGVRDMFDKSFTSGELNGMKANEMIAYWRMTPEKWELITISQAFFSVNDGWFVVAGHDGGNSNGHVVVIVPGSGGRGNWVNKADVLRPNAMDIGYNKRWASRDVGWSWGEDLQKHVEFYRYR